MLSIPQYLIESSFCLILFYSFYHFFLSKETFFQLNRVYLLSTPILSLGIPFLNITYRKESLAEETLEAVIYPAIQTAQEVQTVFWEQMDAPSPLFSLSVSDIILGIYMAGVCLMSLTLLKSLLHLSSLILRSKKQKKEGYTKVELEADFPAASFFGYIFWNQKIADEKKVILEHEKVHIRQWHSVDVLLMELIVIVKWFNPLIYFFRNALKVTHEFIADQYMVQKKINVASYAHLLVHTNKLQAAPLTNTFYSMTKQRLKMLLRRPSKNRQVAKYLFVIPMVFGLMSLFSFNLIEELQPIKQGLENIDAAVDDLGNKTVVEMTLNQQMEASGNYQIRWGKYTFDCQTKLQGKRRYCNCDRKYIAKADLKTINKTGIKFYKADKKVDFKNITVSAIGHVYCEKEDLMMTGEQQEKYNKKACIWNAFDEEDIGRVAFQTDEFYRVNFTFGIDSENANQKIPANQFVLGEEVISLNNLMDPNSSTITYDQASKLLDKRAYMEYYGKQQTVHEVKFNFFDGSISKEYDLAKTTDKAFLDAKVDPKTELLLLPMPHEENGLTINLHVLNRIGNSMPINSFTWGKYQFSYKNPKVKLTKKEFLDLVDNHAILGPSNKPLENISDIFIYNSLAPTYHTSCDSEGTWEEVINGVCFQEKLEQVKEGSILLFNSLKASPILIGSLSIFIDNDPKRTQAKITIQQANTDKPTHKYKRHGYWHYQNVPFADIYGEVSNSRYGTLKIEGTKSPNVDVFVQPSNKAISDEVMKEKILAELRKGIPFTRKEKYIQQTDWYLSGGDVQKMAKYREENVSPNLEFFNEQVQDKGLESVGPINFSWLSDRYFELQYGIKVIDLTGISGRYILPLKTKNLQKLQKQLKKDFGLILKEETRTISKTFVRVSQETQ